MKIECNGVDGVIQKGGGGEQTKRAGRRGTEELWEGEGNS